MKLKMDGLRPVYWNNPGAMIIADKRGDVVFFNYKDFLSTIGHDDVNFKNVKDLISYLSEEPFDPENFNTIYHRISKGKALVDEYDLNLGGMHYHLNLYHLERGHVAIHFGDQTLATKARRAAEKSVERGQDVIHVLKNALAGISVSRAASRHIVEGNEEWALRLLNAQGDTEAKAVGDSETLLNIVRAEEGCELEMGNHLYKADIIEPVISLVSRQMVSKRATFQRELSSEYEDVNLFCDKGRMQSVFFHLSHNALEHGREGLLISAGYEPIFEEDEKIGNNLIFWNSKSRIPEEDLENVFKRYHGKGTGLGLDRVRNTIVNEHKGIIQIESGFDDYLGDDFTKVIIGLYDEGYLLENNMI